MVKIVTSAASKIISNSILIQDSVLHGVVISYLLTLFRNKMRHNSLFFHLVLFIQLIH